MEENNSFLRQIVKGASVIFTASLLLYIFRFIYRIIVSRALGPEGYGMISIGEMFLNFAGLIALLGLHHGISRYVPHYKSLKEEPRMVGSFLGGFKVALIFSILVSALLIIFSKFISVSIFHNENLFWVIIIFSLIIPLSNLLTLFNNTFLAFKKPIYHLISVVFGRNFLSLILAGIVILIGGSVLAISWVYLVSFAFACFVAFFFLEKKVFPFFKSRFSAKINYKQLFIFSIPLLFSGIFVNIMAWADTFFIGSLKNVSDVGVYNVAAPLAASLIIFLTSFSHIFYPIMCELKAKGDVAQIGVLYSNVLRWVFLFSLPFVLIVIFFPQQILNFFFGSEYVAGSLVLVVLVSASFLNIITGPCIQVLMVFNKTRFIFYLNLVMGILNVILNLILIPSYGINGAAFATGFVIVLREFILFFMARKKIRFTYSFRYYLKYLLSGTISLGAVYFVLVRFFYPFSLVEWVIGALCFLLMYGLLLLLLRSFNQEDLQIMVVIEKKLGFKSSFLRRIIKRFL